MPVYAKDLTEHLRAQSLAEGAISIGFTKIRKVEPVIVLAFPFTDRWFLHYPLRVAKSLAKEAVASNHVLGHVKNILIAEGFTAHCKSIWSVFGDFRPLAVSAGLGSWGRQGIIVNQQFGSGLLFAAIFTNAPLHAEIAANNANGCSECGQCIQACPGNAFGQNRFQVQRCLPYCLKGCAECIKICTGKKT